MTEQKRKIAISENTLNNITDDFLDKLKENEDIEIVVVGNDLIHEVKMLGSQGISGVILSKEEQAEEIELRQVKEKVFEINDFKLPETKEIYIKPQNKAKHFVPKVIGKPQNKKRGSR